MWVGATSGGHGALVDVGLTYNPSTAVLTTTTFSGALSGNATTATTATNSNNLLTTSTTANTNFFLLFSPSSTTGTQAVNMTTGINVNPSTDIMSLTGVKLSGLTASYVVATDSLKNLVSTNTSTVYAFGTSTASLDVKGDTGLTVISGTGNTVAQILVSDNGAANFISLWSGRSGDANPLIFWSATTTLRFGTATNPGTTGFTLLYTFDPSGNFGSAGGMASTSGNITASNGNFVIGTNGKTLNYPLADGDKILFFGVTTGAKIDTATGFNFNFRSGNTGTASSGLFNWYTVNGSSAFANVMSLSNTGVLALTGGTLTITSAGNVAQAITSTTTGSANNADIFLTRGDSANGFNRIVYKTGSTVNWSVGQRSGSSNYLIFDEVNTLTQLSMTPGSGTTGTSTFTGSVSVGTTLTTNILVVTNAGGSSIQMANTGEILGKNTGGTYETAIYPRYSDNAMYLSGGAGGIFIRVNSTTTAITIDTSGNTSLATGNLVLSTATSGYQQKSAAVVAGAANSTLVTGVVLTAGSSGAITNTAVTSSHIGFARLTSVSGTPTFSIVTCGAGSFSVAGAATDNSTYAVLFIKAL